MMTRTKKELKIIKSASPEALFARFLQKKAKAAAPSQLNVWENDGGQINGDCEDFVIIGGHKCHTLFERCRAHIMKFWRLTRFYIYSNQPHLSK